MSNSRALRRRIARVYRPKPRFPEKPPALGTTRRWLNAAMANGDVERRVAEPTGEPGRRPYEYRLTAQGKERAEADPRDWKAMLTELQAKRVHALMKKGMSEKRAIAAVTRGWRRAG
jgi:hypothetical protein